jgi:DsbC/DsbD-like thiol-disulfide interchange protein
MQYQGSVRNTNTQMKLHILLAAPACTLLSTMHAQTNQAPEGHAKVDLLTSTSTFQAGTAVQAALRMTYDDGWHGYWINPGDAGMKTAITWKLPKGWKATEAEFPVPERTSKNNIHSYHYHGTILIPVIFIAPKGAEGSVDIEGQVEWLACNEKQCVAGNATVKIALAGGLPTPTADAPAIQKAVDSLPQASPHHVLLRRAEGKLITLTVQGPGLENFDGAEILPITEQALDPAHLWKFSVKDGICTATGPINEYAEEGAEMTLDLCVHGGKLPKPVLLRWSKKS